MTNYGDRPIGSGFHTSIYYNKPNQEMENSETRQRINSGFSPRTSTYVSDQEQRVATSGFNSSYRVQHFTVDRITTSGFAIRRSDLSESIVDRPRADSCFMIRQGAKQELVKGYMIKARDLWARDIDDPNQWQFRSMNMSRYGEVLELLMAWWLEVNGSMKVQDLSPNKNYGVYFVYNLSEDAGGFEMDNFHIEMGIRIAGGDDIQEKRQVFLEIGNQNQKYPPRPRGDGWMEIEMGEFVNDFAEDAEIKVTIQQVGPSMPRMGLFIEGIEFRPREDII